MKSIMAITINVAIYRLSIDANFIDDLIKLGDFSLDKPLLLDKYT